jgi:hypothetical protein
MSRHRFKLMCRYITFDDLGERTSRQAEDPKLYKISQVFNAFNENIQSAYKPSKQLCIDETLYPFRGRSNLVQYMKSKPTRYGLKYYNICDVKNSYLLKSIFYKGK